MKLNLSKKIVTIRGQQANESSEGKIIPLNIKEVLLSLLPVAECKGRESVTMWDIALKVKNCEKNEIELAEEEFEFIKKVVGENFRGKGLEGEIITYFQPFVIAQTLKEMEEKQR